MNPCNAHAASEEYADFIFRHGNTSLDNLIQSLNTDCISYVDEEYAIVHYPLAQAEPISISRQSYLAIPFLYSLLDTTSMEQSGILDTFAQPSLNYQGDGVLIGFIDTGIDYQNPLFRKENGDTRVLGIWDQTVPGDGFVLQSPRGQRYPFLYGQEYQEETINEALKSEDPLSVAPSTDTIGHGTFLAGIAAGKPLPDNSFIGAAPKASIGIVKLKPAKQYLRNYYMIPSNAIAYQSNDIMMGISYLRLLAARYRMPLVICIGLGSNQGGHNGAAPVSDTLNNLQTLLGVTAVCAAGNEAGFRHHYLGHISANTGYDEVELRVAEGERGFLAELWADFPEVYTLGFVSPTGEVIDRIAYRRDEDTTVRFSLEETSITVSYVASIGPQSSYLAYMRFTSPSAGLWRIRVYPTVSITGIFHIWLPVQGFVSDETVFLEADPYTTITGPGNAQVPITASTYNHLNGSLYIHSSRGYTRDGRIKPDLAAPGVDVYGPGISSVPGDFPMTRMTGSSVAAAHVAGAAANLYSWGYVHGNYPTITTSAIKAYLTRGAKRSTAYTYPNREWGFGTLNLYQSFLSLRD